LEAELQGVKQDVYKERGVMRGLFLR
jgi:hypothetical protein